jgi:hypothetical protein
MGLENVVRYKTKSASQLGSKDILHCPQASQSRTHPAVILFGVGRIRVNYSNARHVSSIATSLRLHGEAKATI